MYQRLASSTAAGLTAVLVMAGVAFAALEPTPRGVMHAGLGFAAVIWAMLGIVVGRRATGRVVGLLMTLVAFHLAFTTVKETGWVVLAARTDLQSDLTWLVAVLNESAWWLIATLALLLLYFPDGRLPSSRWQLLPPVLLVAAAIHQTWGAMGVAFRPPLAHLEPPFSAPPLWLELAGFVAFLTLVFGFIACALSLVMRFHHADRTRRAQLKWLAIGGFGVPIYLIGCLIEVFLFGGPAWPSVVVGIATIVGLPIAVAIAMLRYDLYDIDRAIAATTTYALVTGSLVLVFLLASVVVGTGLGQGSALTAATATALSAAALAPVRRAAQRRVDHHLYPQREAALMAIRSLEQRTHSGAARPEQLEHDLRVALRDPGLRIAYYLPGGHGLVDGAGSTVDVAGSVPITMGGSAIGALIPTSPSLSAGLLREVAGAAGTLVEIVRLRVELTGAVHEIEASRARLVQVGDEERRRLERDLHDGAQQRLVALGMSLRLAQRRLRNPNGVLDVDALIDQTVAELGTAVAELRQIAHGLRPSRLDDGLPAALSALSRGLPVPIELDLAPVELPDHLATTIYFVASEALANAVKYAGASRIGVRVTQDTSGVVEVRVHDDGQGGAVIRHGSGLAGLRDRVAALGGAFAVETAVGRGTVVEARLPCGS